MLTLLQLGLLTVIVIGGLISAYVAGFSLALGFLPGFALLVYFAVTSGNNFSTISKGIKKGITQIAGVMAILMFIAIIIPAWTASGTIPYMIDTGLALIQPSLFLTSAFILTLVTSMILGTSIGALSVVGIPLIGAAAIQHIPLPLVAGALVSGAFVGDRTSPLSSAYQLVAVVTNQKPEQHGKALLPTTWLGLAISLLFFLGLDIAGQWGGVQLGHVSGLENGLESNLEEWFHFHPILLAPPAVLTGAIILRIPIKYAFPAAILSSIVIGSILQGITAWEWMHDIWSGYDRTEFAFLEGKGIAQMIGLIIFIGMAGAFNGVLEETGMIQPYMKRVLGANRSLLTSTIRTGAFGLGMCMLACNQTLPMMISGRNILPEWRKQFAAADLSRVIADTIQMFAGLVPWNMLAIMCSTILNVPLLKYLPYAIFLWILPLLTLVLSGKRGIQITWKRSVDNRGV